MCLVFTSNLRGLNETNFFFYFVIYDLFLEKFEMDGENYVL